MPKRSASSSRRTVALVQTVPADATDITPLPEPGTQEALELLARAAASPIPLDETIVRLGQLLRRDFNYKRYRARQGTYTAYDEVLESSMEAVASAVHYLQQAQQLLQAGGTQP